MKQKTIRRIICIIIMLSLFVGFLPFLKIQNSFAKKSATISARINGLPQQNGESLDDIIAKIGVVSVTSIYVISGTITEADLQTIADYKDSLEVLEVESSVTPFDIPDNFLNGTMNQPNIALQHIVLPNVTTIGANAFAYCTQLTTATFEQVATISENAFESCSSLNRLTLGVTPPTIAETSFANCTATNKLLYIPLDSVALYDEQDEVADGLWNGFFIVGDTIVDSATRLDISKGNIVLSEQGASGYDSLGNEIIENALNPFGYEITGATDEYSISVTAFGSAEAPIMISLHNTKITAQGEDIPLNADKNSYIKLNLIGENELLNGGIKGGTVTVQGTGQLYCEGKTATVDKMGGTAIETQGAFLMTSGRVEAVGGESTVAVYSGGNAMKVGGLSVTDGTLVATAGVGINPEKAGIGIWNLATWLSIQNGADVKAFGSKSIAFGLNAEIPDGLSITSNIPATFFVGNLKSASSQETAYIIGNEGSFALVNVPSNMTSFATTVYNDGVCYLRQGEILQQHTTSKNTTTDFDIVASKLNYFSKIEPYSQDTPPDESEKNEVILNITATPVANSEQVNFAATVLGKNAIPVTGQIKYQVDFLDVAAVDIVNGVVPTYNWTPTMAKKYNITAAYLGDDNYKATIKTIEYTVPKLPQSSFKFIDKVNSTYTYGDNAFQARAEASETNGAVTYKSSNDKVLAVDSKGVVTIKGQGTATITATKAGNEMYSEASVTTQTITVHPKELVATAANKSATVGGSLPSFTVKVTGFVNGETESSLASAGYKAPTATCTATTEKAGTYDITVSGGTPTANYKFKYVNGKLTVSTYTAPSKTVLEDSNTNTSVSMADGSSFGNDITLSVQTVTSNIPAKDMEVYKKNVNAAAKGKVIIKIYDIKLLENGKEVQPASKVNVKLKVSSDYDKYKNLQIAYIDKYGNVTLHTTEVKDGYIHFTTDHFSNYAVIGTPVATTNPATGDNITLLYVFLGGVLIVMVLGFVLLKKSKRT